MRTRVLVNGNRKLIVDVDSLRRSLKPAKEIWDGNLNHSPVNGIGWKLWEIFRYAKIIAKGKINVLSYVPATKTDKFFKNKVFVLSDTCIRMCDISRFTSTKPIKLAVVPVQSLDFIKHIYDINIDGVGITEEDCKRGTVAVLIPIESDTKQKQLLDIKETLNWCQKMGIVA